MRNTARCSRAKATSTRPTCEPQDGASRGQCTAQRESGMNPVRQDAGVYNDRACQLRSTPRFWVFPGEGMTMMTTSLAQPSGQRGQFRVVPCEASLGAEIHGIDLRAVDGPTFAATYETWLDHVLLVFRGQTLGADDLVNLVRRFGTPVSSSNLHQRNLDERAPNKLYNLPPEVTAVSNVREGGKAIGILGDGEVVWHSDFSFKERPTAARMLVAMEVPPSELGGNTYFLNCYAAYDALSDEMKARVSGKSVKQANIIDTAMKLRPGASLEDDIRTTPGPSHPIISTHPETGCNTIFLGRRHGAYVSGCSLKESEALLNELWAHCTQSRFW